jgi:hypothetical protein
MQDVCVWTKKDRVGLRVCWRTAASEHGRSYAISRYPNMQVAMAQGILCNRVARWPFRSGLFGSFGLSCLSGLLSLSGSLSNQINETGQIDQQTRATVCSLS